MISLHFFHPVSADCKRLRREGTDFFLCRLAKQKWGTKSRGQRLRAASSWHADQTENLRPSESQGVVEAADDTTHDG